MHQHYKVVFKEDIYNMKILTELTVSLLFALRLSNYLSVTSFMHDVLSVVRAHEPLENFELESSRDTCSFGSAGQSFLPSGMEI